jgi:hypothetical protein
MSPAGLPRHSEKARWRHALTWVGNERVLLILEAPLVSRGAIGQGVARRSRLLHHVTVIFTLQDERGTASSSKRRTRADRSAAIGRPRGYFSQDVSRLQIQADLISGSCFRMKGHRPA